MATIPKDLGAGGKGLFPNQGSPINTLVEILNGVQEDLVDIQTTMDALTTKLDADTGVTDTDYNATIATTVTTQKEA